MIRQQDFVNTYCQMCSQGDARAFAEHLFRGYDTDGDGAIDFQEFMCTLSISAKGSPEERLAWAFNMYDSNGDGCLSMNEAVDIISVSLPKIVFLYTRMTSVEALLLTNVHFVNIYYIHCFIYMHYDMHNLIHG